MYKKRKEGKGLVIKKFRVWRGVDCTIHIQQKSSTSGDRWKSWLRGTGSCLCCCYGFYMDLRAIRATIILCRMPYSDN